MQIFDSNGEYQPATLPPGRARHSVALFVSAVIHGLALAILLWRPAALFIKPRLLARGNGGTATPVSVSLYLPHDAALAKPITSQLQSISAPARETQKVKLHKRSNILDNDKVADSTEAGSLQGSALDGSTEGDEVKPGFAVNFTDPRVARWELPGGISGDVVVELTIDAQGNVVEEKLLQGLGQSIDDRVIATLRDWHFRPATRNGVAIPFKYDAHFHFPS